MGGLKMKKHFAGIALAVALAQPATAITFPSLTTIYIISGVKDDGGALNSGIATSVHCTNVSGVDAVIRLLALDRDGTIAGTVSLNLLHGQTRTESTHLTAAFNDGQFAAGDVIDQGAINVEATQSGIFCSAMIVDASAALPTGVDLHTVRVNPHPGTVE
jgi:hypothetical protein